MIGKPVFTATLVPIFAFSMLTAPSPAHAESACGASYLVAWGDSLSGVSRKCGTSVAAIRLANPQIGYWLYAGQTLWLPGAYLDNGNGYATYIVEHGDTLKALAIRFSTTMENLGKLNGIRDYNVIYEGQRLSIPVVTSQPPSPMPSRGGMYVVGRGDTLRKISDRVGISLADLIAVNSQIANPSSIFPGQVIFLPATASFYTVQRGDTLKIIATRFDTSVNDLVSLNPQIWNPDRIYAGQVVRFR